MIGSVTAMSKLQKPILQLLRRLILENASHALEKGLKYACLTSGDWH